MFSQAALPLLLKGVQAGAEHPPTLIFTGATASVKANALMSSFNTGKFALRALSSSLAKEFGPKGIHVSHAIIDGVIDIPRTKGWLKDAGPDAKISPAAVSNTFKMLAAGMLTYNTRSRKLIGTFILNIDRLSSGKLTLDLGLKSGRC